jgi:hypothetical protein
MSCARHSRRVACGGAALLLGCSRSVLTTEQGAALVAAEDRWKRSGFRDYSFEFRPFDGLAFDECAARIEERGGVVEKVTELGSHRPDPTTIDAFSRPSTGRRRAGVLRGSMPSITQRSAIPPGSSSWRPGASPTAT